MEGIVHFSFVIRKNVGRKLWEKIFANVFWVKMLVENGKENGNNGLLRFEKLLENVRQRKGYWPLVN